MADKDFKWPADSLQGVLERRRDAAGLPPLPISDQAKKHAAAARSRQTQKK